MTRGDCPICGASEPEVFFEMPSVPVFCNVLWPSRSEAVETPRGDIHLAFCDACGMIFNRAFEPDLTRYAPGYENSLHGSPSFQAYAEGLARRLIDTYDIRGCDVVELGAGRGEFLELLCDLGGNRGIGYDPSVPEHGEPSGRSWKVIRGEFSEELPLRRRVRYGA